MCMEDQLIEDFGKGKMPQDASQERKEHEGETLTPACVEEEDNDDSTAVPPRDDDGEDEIIDDIIDDVSVDEEEHGQVNHDQREPTNVRKSARVRIPSTQYPLLEYVQVTKRVESETFDEVKAHVSRVDWMRVIHYDKILA